MSLPRLALLSCLLAAGAAHAQAPDDPVAHYRVTYAGEDAFRVEATFAVPAMQLDLNSHESSRELAQAGSVKDLVAYGADGLPIPIAFVGNGTWKLGGRAASRVTYTLVADHDAYTWIAGK